MFNVNTDNRADYYAYLARLNFLCAKEADKVVGLLPGYEIAAPPPVMTLCAHAIELALKAQLLRSGMTEEDVREISHNLVKLWQKLKQSTSDLPDIDEEILRIISDLLMSGRLRYGEPSKLGKVPVFGPLEEVVQKCLHLCNAPDLQELLD